MKTPIKLQLFHLNLTVIKNIIESTYGNICTIFYVHGKYIFRIHGNIGAVVDSNDNIWCLVNAEFIYLFSAEIDSILSSFKLLSILPF